MAIGALAIGASALVVSMAQAWGRTGAGDHRPLDRIHRHAWRVDLETASREELALLPGIGPATAQRIVEVRERDGRIGGVDALRRVRGIGAATIEHLRPWIAEHSGSP